MFAFFCATNEGSPIKFVYNVYITFPDEGWKCLGFDVREVPWSNGECRGPLSDWRFESQQVKDLINKVWTLRNI